MLRVARCTNVEIVVVSYSSHDKLLIHGSTSRYNFSKQLVLYLPLVVVVGGSGGTQVSAGKMQDPHTEGTLNIDPASSIPCVLARMMASVVLVFPSTTIQSFTW
jgi:hypothetical protein